MSRYWIAAILGAGLTLPATVHADDRDRSYHDVKHNDDHAWNANEDRAYREWVKENHRKYNDFSKLKVRDRELYWNWRHDHPDHDDHDRDRR